MTEPKQKQHEKPSAPADKARVYVNGETFDVVTEGGGVLIIRRPNGSKQYAARRLGREAIYGANRAQIIEGRQS